VSRATQRTWALPAIPCSLALAAALNLGCGRPAENEATDLARHRELLLQAIDGHARVVFLGDSLTDQWRIPGGGLETWRREYVPLGAANLGISGEDTLGLLDRVTRSRMEDLAAEAIVLLIGTNDVSAGAAPEEIARRVEAIVDVLRERLPRARILLLGLFPRDADSSPRREAVRAVNRFLARSPGRANVRYLDIGDRFLLPDRTIPRNVMPDGLHLSPEGYRIWADAIGPALNDILSPPADGGSR
jgi:lysophospholipase L1-like esterase